LGGAGPGGHDGHILGRQGRVDGVGQGGRADMTAVFKGVRAASTACDRRTGGWYAWGGLGRTSMMAVFEGWSSRRTKRK
jgi:hypothetical protein